MGKYDEHDEEYVMERDKDGNIKIDGPEAGILAAGMAVALCIYAWFKGKKD